MGTAKVAGWVVTGITLVCVAFLVALLVLKALWAWTVPDLFPGAVAQGLIAAEISWLTAAKLAMLAAALSAGVNGSFSNRHAQAG